MNKLRDPYMNKIKTDIKNRYLAGETIKSQATDYGCSARNIYYHLGTLTLDEKALHIKNLMLRGMTPKFKNKKKIKVTYGKEDHEEKQPGNSEKGQGSEGTADLDGFV